MIRDQYDRSRLDRDVAALDDLPVYVAYNANVDAVVRVDEGLEAFLARPADPGDRPPPSRISSGRDLATAITRTMAAGRGDEVATTDAFATELESELTPDTQQLGGQAGIMTDLLASLGAAPIVYTYLLSERQLAAFTSPEAIRYPVVEDDSVTYVPLTEAVDTDRTKINWVFEFREGDELFGVRATDDTRFIAASRPPEFDLRAGALDGVVDRLGADVDGALLAGYHNLTPEIVDDGYEGTMRHARDVVRRLRSGGDLPVHVEYAVTHDEELRRAIYEWVLPEADVVGTDTHELSILYDDADHEVAEEVPTEETPFDPREILTHHRMIAALLDELGVDCIRVHAMEYHLAVMDSYLPPDAVRRGLEFAAVNAATKAARGDVTSPADLRTGLEYAPSERGREAVERLGEAVDEPVRDGVLASPSVVACPNRVVEDPAGTVGIGDVVSSSSFVREVADTNAGDETSG